MSSSLSIRNMHWTIGIREQMFDEALISKKERALLASQKLRDLLDDKNWYEWLATTPDDNAGFLAAVETKLSEVLGGARAVSMTTSVTHNGGL